MSTEPPGAHGARTGPPCPVSAAPHTHCCLLVPAHLVTRALSRAMLLCGLTRLLPGQGCRGDGAQVLALRKCCPSSSLSLRPSFLPFLISSLFPSLLDPRSLSLHPHTVGPLTAPEGRAGKRTGTRHLLPHNEHLPKLDSQREPGLPDVPPKVTAPRSQRSREQTHTHEDELEMDRRPKCKRRDYEALRRKCRSQSLQPWI